MIAVNSTRLTLIGNVCRTLWKLKLSEIRKHNVVVFFFSLVYKNRILFDYTQRMSSDKIEYYTILSVQR